MFGENRGYMTDRRFDTPYEKFLELGPGSLTDTELLAIIIRNGTRDEDAHELAMRILSAGDDEGRIIGLQKLSFDDLTAIKGIGKVKAMCIGCIVELSMRMAMQNKKKVLMLNNPESIADYFMEQVRHLEQENVLLLLVDTKCNLMKVVNLSKGSINASIVSVRDIYINAVGSKASGVILIHNHPSGDPTPSRNDIDITQKIRKAGEIMEIPLLDHIIIGDRRYVSLKQGGYV